MAISNKYKDTLNNLIDSSDTEFPDWPDSPDQPGLIDKRSCNAPRSKDNSPTFLEEDRLNENVPVRSLEPAPKIPASQVHKHHKLIPFGPKTGRVQYGNSQKGR